MQFSKHLRLLIIVTVAWFIFWLAGLPDYYQQYSDTTMLLFDLIVLPPIWYLVYRSVKQSRLGRALTESLWWSFYISVPLLIFDLLFCSFYLGYGLSFLWEFWYLSVYYIIPWIIFPPTGWWVDRRRSQA